MSAPGKHTNTAPRILGTRALAAINAVEGLKLGAASKKRLQALQNDPTLTPDQRRAEVLRAYAALSRAEEGATRKPVALLTASMMVMETSTGLRD